MTHAIAMSAKYVKHWLRGERPKWRRTQNGYGPWTVEYRRGKRHNYHSVKER